MTKNICLQQLTCKLIEKDSIMELTKLTKKEPKLVKKLLLRTFSSSKYDKMSWKISVQVWR